jgi:hypothetical protein
MAKKMNKATLRYLVTQTGSNYFARKSMKFFGDTMANMACNSQPIEITNTLGEKRQVYGIWRKSPPPMLGYKTDYFDAVTFARVFPCEADKYALGPHKA